MYMVKIKNSPEVIDVGNSGTQFFMNFNDAKAYAKAVSNSWYFGQIYRKSEYGWRRVNRNGEEDFFPSIL